MLGAKLTDFIRIFRKNWIFHEVKKFGVTHRFILIKNFMVETQMSVDYMSNPM
jgi:hypothetical protein